MSLTNSFERMKVCVEYAVWMSIAHVVRCCSLQLRVFSPINGVWRFDVEVVHVHG